MENEKKTDINQPFIEEPINALNALFRLLYEGQEFTYSEYNFWLKLHQIVAEALEKLEQLKEIEKELGIDLITLFKALKDGVWVKNEFGQIYHTNVYLYDLSLAHCLDKNRFCFLMNNVFLLFDDYRKKWALDEKELENDK